MRGEVTVRATCLMPERLLERALAQGARFDSIRRDGAHDLVVDCDAASARILLDQCARYRLDARVLRQRGKTAFLAFLKRRATLPVGWIVALALCWLFLGRVWLVDVTFTGEAAALGDRTALTQALEIAGIRPGMRRDADLSALTQALQADLGGYSYIGASLRGVRLLVEAAPEVPSPPLYDVAAARDLVSDRDGIVLSAVARSGSLCVQPGDAVRRGQLLIRGEEKATADETRPIAALGEVVVRAWFTGEAELPLYETQARFTGRASSASRLMTPWLVWPITEGETFDDAIREVETLPIGGLYLPLAIERVTQREVERRAVPRDADALRTRLATLSMADAAARLSASGAKACDILRRWIDYETVGDAMHARAVIEISVDAATTRDALAESDNQRE